ncbi:MAG: YkgJ family cysteine cluster protein [Planctomycetota bacterium]
MPSVLCEHCSAMCCQYIALPLDKPETKAEFDDLRWFLIHERVFVFVEDGDWYIGFQSPCRHLQADQRCGIYETRPRICRKYSTENCDYHSGDYGWEHHFTCAEHVDEYLRTRGKQGDGAEYAAAEEDRRGVRLPVLGRGVKR